MITSLALLLALLGTASAQDAGPPKRTIPPSLLGDLETVQERFEVALAADCDRTLCYSKGCSYLAHTLADRPPSSSMPGLGEGPGPGSVVPQAWLTQARCEFAYESSLEVADARALARRLQLKVSSGYTVVEVGSQALPALPVALQDEPPVEEPVPEPPPGPPPPPDPLRELWLTLLDHFYWMIGLGLVTVCAGILIWAWRRLGRESLEERMLLADLASGATGDKEEDEPDQAAPAPVVEDEALAGKVAGWRLRLAGMDALHPDPELQAMLRDLLRAGELPLLAKAVLTFPTLPKVFPSGGDVASSKLALAEYLKTADLAALPSESELLAALSRHASAAALTSQRDADVVRSLREEFGSAGLVALMDDVPARSGALLFALAPSDLHQELVHLLSPVQMSEMAEQLLLSNRMDPAETEHLFALLRTAGDPGAASAVPAPMDVSDRGFPFDAPAALSALLPRLSPAERGPLFAAALKRFGGSLPSWYAEILVPEMLFALTDESRADLLLGVDGEALAAWLSLLEPAAAERVLAGTPGALQASVRAASGFASRARQVALADRGRRELAKGFQAQLARDHLRFEDVVRKLSESK